MMLTIEYREDGRQCRSTVFIGRCPRHRYDPSDLTKDALRFKASCRRCAQLHLVYLRWSHLQESIRVFEQLPI